jgi:hypothetical protein
LAVLGNLNCFETSILSLLFPKRMLQEKQEKKQFQKKKEVEEKRPNQTFSAHRSPPTPPIGFFFVRH